ncbi:hypothetical protein MMC21_006967 [Puttea exsequens]|nr:hypothetical protein [Puttea exsequens]
MAGLMSVRGLAEELDNVVESTGLVEPREDVGTNLTSPQPRTGDTDIGPAISTPSMTGSVINSAPIQSSPELSGVTIRVLLHADERRTTHGSPSQTLSCAVSSPFPQPQYLSDVFLYIDHERYIDYLGNRTAEANLVFEYSTLLLDSSQTSNQLPEITKLFLEAACFAGQKDLERLLNTL